MCHVVFAIIVPTFTALVTNGASAQFVTFQSTWIAIYEVRYDSNIFFSLDKWTSSSDQNRTHIRSYVSSDLKNYYPDVFLLFIYSYIFFCSILRLLFQCPKDFSFLFFQVCFDELRFGPLLDSLGASMPNFEIGRLFDRNQILLGWSEVGIRLQMRNETINILWMKVFVSYR